MRIDMSSRSLVLSKSDRDYGERRLGFALGRFSDRLTRVGLTVDDMNGPRGGVDKSVRIVISLRRGEPVTVTSQASTVREAVGTAARHARRVVKRRLDRERRHNGGSIKQIEEAVA